MARPYSSTTGVSDAPVLYVVGIDVGSDSCAVSILRPDKSAVRAPFMIANAAPSFAQCWLPTSSNSFSRPDEGGRYGILSTPKIHRPHRCGDTELSRTVKTRASAREPSSGGAARIFFLLARVRS